ncbi:AAA family ATPase [Rhabdochromatium marinum]|uniref:AAA family ATPase n=1 Tax=Rhabdochromatium marinum TaxID=48729 RepID=UPI001903333A|nr:AAA family ATPase [Rhabdochromatium marinum]MBK1647914.1 hypothetical protein [Rhabdochromatium marinum]
MPLTPECLAQLGLQTEPFDPVPEEAALYRDTLLDGFGDLALRALAEPSAVLMLAGVGGVGRSTQLQQILSLLGDDIELIAFRARPRVNFEAIDATLRFHLGELGSADSHASLVHLFGERLRAGRVLILAIDDAHLLAPSVLEQFFVIRRQLLERQGVAMRFFLVGDPTFAGNPLPGLDAEDDARTPRLHLRAFNREQTQAYLSHRLRAAGHAQPERLVKRDLVERLHGDSSGLPKLLNALAQEWLEAYCEPGGPALTPTTNSNSTAALPAAAESPPDAEEELAPQDAMVTAMAALEALRNASREALQEPAAGQMADSQSSPATFAQSLAAAQAEETADPPPTRPRRARKSKSRSKTQATRIPTTVPLWNRPWFVPGVALFSLLILLVPLLWQLPDSNNTGVSTAVRSIDPPANAPQPRPPLAPGVPRLTPGRSAEPEPATPPLVQRELDVPLILSGDTDPAPSIAQSWGGDQTPPPASIPAQTPAPAPIPADQADATAETSARPAVEPPPPASPPAETVEERANNDTPIASNDAGLDRDWILQQSGDAFTIQLAATRSLISARQYVQGVSDFDLHFVPTRSRSEDFVVILAGVYPARAAAERALAKLPATLREQGYWIRSISSVRQSLRD